MSDEQHVRRQAGWIGVEISRSRVRTQGKAGYGLYRVRTAAERHWHVPHPKVEADGEWTPYAFTLEQVRAAVVTAIEGGLPESPPPLRLGAWPDLTPEYRVLTRWTPAYTGLRNLGCGSVTLRPEYVAELDELAPLLDEGLVEMVHVEGCACVDSPARMSAACVRATMPERMRQRAGNAAFQAEHLERRRHGLKARHAAKLGNIQTGHLRDGPAR